MGLKYVRTWKLTCGSYVYSWVLYELTRETYVRTYVWVGITYRSYVNLSVLCENLRMNLREKLTWEPTCWLGLKLKNLRKNLREKLTCLRLDNSYLIAC